MAYNTAKMITDADGKLIPQMYDPVEDVYKPLTPDAYNNINVNSGSLSVDNFPSKQQVEVTGSSMEYYGATQAERPDISTVPTGAIYLAVDTQETWQSNGTSWVVI